MRVLFDLRAQKIVAIQKTHVSPLRLLSVLFFAGFVVVSLFNIGYTLVHLRDMRAQLSSVRGEEAALTTQTERIDAEISTLRAYREKIRAYVEFAKAEMPSVEFLSSLEGAMPEGVKLTRLEMKPGAVVMRGVALTDQGIIDLGGRLGSMKNIVAKVDAPVTARTTLGSLMILEFTMPCAINTVAEAAVAPAPENAAEEGGAQ